MHALEIGIGPHVDEEDTLPAMLDYQIFDRVGPHPLHASALKDRINEGRAYGLPPRKFTVASDAADPFNPPAPPGDADVAPTLPSDGGDGFDMN